MAAGQQQGAEAPDPVRVQHLAEAYVHVARANHYMVGIVNGFTEAEFDAAEQLLISQENVPHGEHGYIELALDLMEARRRDRLAANSADFNRGWRERRKVQAAWPCLQMQPKPCRELWPDDTEQWCGKCTDAAAAEEREARRRG